MGEKTIQLFKSVKFVSARKVIFDCSYGELSNSVRLGALLAPHPQFTIAPSFECGKYLKLINLKTPQWHLTARMESYQTVCSSVRFAHLAPQLQLLQILNV